MEENYCGRSCEGCEHSERIGCPGCKTGPGSDKMDICKLASCCQVKANTSCQSCNFSGSCGLVEAHKTTPSYIRYALTSHKSMRERKMSLVPLVGKWQALFFLAIAFGVIEVLSTVGLMLGSVLGIICGVVSGACAIAYAAVVFSMGHVHDGYRVAGLCTAGANVLSLINMFLSDAIFHIGIFISICALVLTVFGIYKEFKGHSEVLFEISDDLSKSWNTLWIWYISVNVADLFIGSMFPFIMLMALLAVVILRFVNLYKTAVLFEQLQSEFESESK